MPGATKNYGVTARLKSDATEINIDSFTFDAPEDKRGYELNCTFSDFAGTIDETLPISFEIGIEKNGIQDFALLMDGGSILDISYKVARLDSRVTIKAQSAMSERWNKSPVLPTVIYDPNQVAISTASEALRGDVVDEDGNAIEPILTPIDNLDLIQLLNYVYVTSLGFTEAITNIPNYPIKRATFPLQSSFHSVAASQLSVFEPVYSADDSDRLLIIDPQGVIPTGLPTRGLSGSKYISIARDKQIGQKVTAVLLSYRENVVTADTGTITDRTEQETHQVGTFGEVGFQQTLITQFIKDFHGDLNNPSRVTNSIVWKIETRTYGVSGGIYREISIETQTDSYADNFQLKTGYTKIVQLLTRLPDDDTLLMRQVQTETNVITYANSQDPNSKIKQLEITSIAGTVIVTDNPDDPTRPSKVSLYEATRTDDFPGDATVELATPIKSIIERWEQKGPDQIEVRYQVYDHLTGKLEQNKTVQHTGTIEVRLGTAEEAVTMLIGTPGRVPASFDAGEIPFTIARGLAQRILDRQGASPTRIPIEFTGLDLALRRGSIRRVVDLLGNEYRTFITSYQIKGENLGRADFDVRMTGTGILLPDE